ncbi:hypothetical protein MPSEU_000115200 [Mayamaea pseudoterrestris]|nr:hypothetical protein MPSEU_000115200 [Mayamaea pseudoterrestris]
MNNSAAAIAPFSAPSSSHREPIKSLMDVCLWEMDDATQLQTWVQSHVSLNVHHDEHSGVANLLWRNLSQSLDALHETVHVLEHVKVEAEEHENGDSMGSPRKKPKRVVRVRTLHDPYRVWLQAWKTNDDEESTAPVAAADGTAHTLDAVTSSSSPALIHDATISTMTLTDDHDDVPNLRGAKLSQLSIGGLVNALAGVAGGCVHKPVPFLNQSSQTSIASAANCSVLQLHETALTLHRVLQTRIRSDILRTTPHRIQQMLASDLTTTEFQTVRRRVYETVMLGKGMRSNDHDDDDEARNLATAPPGSTSTSGVVESFKKCNTCGNNDQTAFVLDAKNGDVICENCGTVVSESIMHEGSQFRKFEGEEDRNHHGDAWNPLYSNSHNMSTTLGGLQVSGGIHGWGAGSKRNLETILRNAHAYTELNVSQFGKTDRKTRVGYKDKQKREAFAQMQHVGDALNLHEAVIQRAKEIFAGFRDDRELVQQFKPVIAACLCEAFEYLSQSGKAILKQDEIKQVEAAAAAVGPVSARGARRNELHSATLAGKGGLMIDFSNIEKDKLEAPSAVVSSSSSPKASEKPTAAWDLLDCRSWLLDASRRIAQQWVEDRSKLEGLAAKKIPVGTVDELEGKLVEHSISLCEYLESQIQARTKNVVATNGIHTHRVDDMSKLSIRWQKGNERGAGGVNGDKQATATAASGRTAGQILILLTAKKLSAILNDEVSGDAFHRELRGVIGKQEELKRQKKLEEASRQRLHQMKRKPYLHARVMS